MKWFEAFRNNRRNDTKDLRKISHVNTAREKSVIDKVQVDNRNPFSAVSLETIRSATIEQKEATKRTEQAAVQARQKELNSLEYATSYVTQQLSNALKGQADIIPGKLKDKALKTENAYEFHLIDVRWDTIFTVGTGIDQETITDGGRNVPFYTWFENFKGRLPKKNKDSTFELQKEFDAVEMFIQTLPEYQEILKVCKKFNYKIDFVCNSKGSWRCAYLRVSF